MFENALMECFIPRELRETNIIEFLTLNPESMSVDVYILKFAQLSCYASEMVIEMKNVISLFLVGLSHHPSKEVKK